MLSIVTSRILLHVRRAGLAGEIVSDTGDSAQDREEGEFSEINFSTYHTSIRYASPGTGIPLHKRASMTTISSITPTHSTETEKCSYRVFLNVFKKVLYRPEFNDSGLRRQNKLHKPKKEKVSLLCLTCFYTI